MEQFLNYVWALLIAYVWNRTHEKLSIASLTQVGSDDQWATWNRRQVTKLSLVTG
jgi:hypothetical protein